MSDIDRRVERAGQRWRDSAPVRAAVASCSAAERRAGRRRVSIRAVVAVAAAVVVLAASTTLAVTRRDSTDGDAAHRTSTHRTPSVVPDGSVPTNIDLQSLVVHDGDRVRAFGSAYRTSNGGWQLCAALAAGGSGEARTSPVGAATDCGPERIAVLSGLAGGVRDGQGIEVTGVLTGKVIAVDGDRSYPYPSTDHRFPPIPCTPPRGGWASVGGVVSDQRAIFDRVEADPDLYGDPWAATLPGVTGADGNPQQVLVIGTVGNVATVRRTLETLATAPLCVYHVPNSQRQLAAARAAAETVLRSVSLNAVGGPSINRVLVAVTRLSDEAAASLQRYAPQYDLAVHIVPER